jgi:uncharacterized protein with LGFP repeats
MSSDTASREIDHKYGALGRENGFLGRATTQLVADIGLNGVPGFHIDYNGGSIYWSAPAGAHVIYGDIRTKWLSIGGPKSNIGYPKKDEASTSDNKARFNDFAIDGQDTGSIYWTSGGGAHLIYGHIWLKWHSVGGPASNLGYPKTDEASTPDNKARFNDFAIDGQDSGSIYWTPGGGAHLIYGHIWLKWHSAGGPASNLGYPKTDEASTPDGRARFNDFAIDGQDTGSIYWSQDGGAHLIYGHIWLKWTSLGRGGSFLRYPVTDEHSSGNQGGRFNDFEGGTIYWSPATGAHEGGPLPDKLEFRRDHHFDNGVAANGSTSLVLHSNGQIRFTGHMHASGLLDYNFVVGYGLLDADKQAYVATQKGSVFGTITPGSRDFDWSELQDQEMLRTNWRAICASPEMNIHAHIAAQFGALIGSLFGFASVIGVVVLFGGVAGGKLVGNPDGTVGRRWEWDT